MYKSFNTKKYCLSFSTFNKVCKHMIVYRAGIRNWVAMDSYNYSLVIGCFRIIFIIKREMLTCGN